MCAKRKVNTSTFLVQYTLVNNLELRCRIVVSIKNDRLRIPVLPIGNFVAPAL